MTTYNGEKYLGEQLDSILNQTYKDLELIICDDCSKDGTKTVLSEYQKKDSRIKLHFNEENLGFKKNFEKAISFCTGEYIAFSDQDDVWNSDKIELCLSKIGEHDLICTDAEVTDEKLNPLGYTMKQRLQTFVVPTDKIELLKYLVHNNFVQGATVLARSDFVKKYLPIPEECDYHDWYYAVCSAIDNGLVYLENPTMKYRQHEKNVIGGKKDSFMKLLKPVTFERDRLIKASYQPLYYINLIRSGISDKKMGSYLDCTEKYFKLLPFKDFYTLKYIKKYYKYLYLNDSFIKKRILLLKRFLGIIRYKLFLQGKNQ